MRIVRESQKSGEGKSRVIAPAKGQADRPAQQQGASWPGSTSAASGYPPPLLLFAQRRVPQGKEEWLWSWQHVFNRIRAQIHRKPGFISSSLQELHVLQFQIFINICCPETYHSVPLEKSKPCSPSFYEQSSFYSTSTAMHSCTISVNNLIIKELFFIKKWIFQIFLVHAVGLFYKHGSSNPTFQFPHQHWFATENIIFQKGGSDILRHSRL